MTTTDRGLRALERALYAGAEYADVRLIETSWEGVRTLDRAVVSVDRGRQLGVGIRAWVRGAWGFASGTDLADRALRDLADRAVRLADGAALLITRPGDLAAGPSVEAEWREPFVRDPFEVPVEDRIRLLITTEEVLRAMPAIRAMAGLIGCSRERKTLMTSEGAVIVQERVVTGAGFRVLAETRDGRAVRSFPTAGRGHFATGGYEVVESLDLPGSALVMRDEATRLVSAPPAPTGAHDVLLSGSAVAALLHQTFGHALEVDATRALQLPLYGRLGQRVASDLVSVVDDPGLPGGLGTAGFDDEGHAADPTPLVEAGVLVGLLTDRESAHVLGLSGSSGSARAAGFNHAPRVRMSNVSLRPGSHRLDDLVAGMEDGLLVDTPVRSWLDDESRRVRLECELGWRIDRGRRLEMVRNPVVEADAADIWMDCDAICGADETALWSVPDCGLGHPRQTLGTSHQTPPARFASVNVTHWGTG